MDSHVKVIRRTHIRIKVKIGIRIHIKVSRLHIRVLRIHIKVSRIRNTELILSQTQCPPKSDVATRKPYNFNHHIRIRETFLKVISNFGSYDKFIILATHGHSRHFLIVLVFSSQALYVLVSPSLL
jgi:hypothetical protein